jgi:hypothetical protein
MHDLHLSVFGSHVPNTTGADVALTRIAYAVYAYHSLTLWSRFPDVQYRGIGLPFQTIGRVSTTIKLHQ